MKIPLALAAVLLVAACGEETGALAQPDPPPPSLPSAVPAADGPVRTNGPVTVLDDGNGAELCVGGVAESYPPQCGGPTLVGWDWSEHDGDFEQANGVRWGEFLVTGDFDGTSFTPSDVVPGDEWDGEYTDSHRDFTTPCPEPDGGWAVVDPSRIEYADQNRTFARASRLPGYASSFVDTSRDTRSGEEIDQDLVDRNEEVGLWIINVLVTGDPAAAEVVLRETWGGPLCVSQGQHTAKELEEIQMALSDLPGMLSSGAHLQAVEVTVIYDDGSIQAWADDEYGADLVRVSSALVPA